MLSVCTHINTISLYFYNLQGLKGLDGPKGEIGAAGAKVFLWPKQLLID